MKIMMRIKMMFRKIEIEVFIVFAERSYVGTRKKWCCRGEVGEFLRVAYHDLFDFFDGSASQAQQTHPAVNLTGCLAKRLEILRSLGKRDPI